MASIIACSMVRVARAGFSAPTACATRAVVPVPTADTKMWAMPVMVLDKPTAVSASALRCPTSMVVTIHHQGQHLLADSGEG